MVDTTYATLVWSPVLGNEKINFQEILGENGHVRVTLNNETLLAAKAVAIRENMRDELAAGAEALVTLSLGHSIGLGIARRNGDTIDLSAPISGTCSISLTVPCAVAAREAVSRPIAVLRDPPFSL